MQFFVVKLAVFMWELNFKMKNTIRFCQIVLGQRIYYRGFYSTVVSVTQKPEGFRITTDNGSILTGHSFDRIALKSNANKENGLF